jgi:uroporphyrinogen decarboxylase
MKVHKFLDGHFGGRKEMNSSERMIAALNLTVPDRVPIAPWAEAPICTYLGASLKDVLIRGDRMAEVQSAAYRTFRYDWISIGMGLAGIQPEALGCKVFYPEDSFPVIQEFSVKDPNDVNKIKVPNPEKDGLLPQYLGGISALKRNVGDEVPICLEFFSPFAIACRFRGVNQILQDIYDNPALVRTLMEISLDTQMQMGKAAIKAGAEMFYLGSDMESPLLISPKHYDEFCKKENDTLIQELKREGAYLIFHMCGDLMKSRMIDRILSSGAQAVSPGNITSEEVFDIGPLKREHGNQICIFANLNPTGRLLEGDPEGVHAEIVDLMDKGKKDGGFILHTSGTMSPKTPLANFEAMMKSGRELGTYEL